MSVEMARYRAAQAAAREALLAFLKAEHGISDADFEGDSCDQPLLPECIPTRRATVAAGIAVVTLLDVGGGSGLYEVLYASGEPVLTGPASSGRDGRSLPAVR